MARQTFAAACAGPHRRGVLQAMLGGFAGLSLAELMRLRAAAAGTSPPRERTAVILLWTTGGMSHIDTYDPKPDAPSEFRGEFKPIATRTPGMLLTELLPRHAALADKFAILRSLAHEAGGHSNGPQRLMTGHYAARERDLPEHPDCLAIASYLRRRRGAGLPNFVGLTTSQTATPINALGPAYLGNASAPFMIFNNVQKAGHTIGLELGDAGGQLPARRGLLARLDHAPRDRAARSMDAFQEQALNLFTAGATRRAFDLTQEPAAARDRYGRTGWGQQCLLARRLVEAGVDLVTVTLSGPETYSRPNFGDGNWDDHAVNSHIFTALKARMPNYDRCVTALIEDLFERGLDRRVLVVVTGEFGRTPRISYANSQYTGVRQPGRDHWPGAMSILFAGGGIRGGQVVGATNKRGEHPVHRHVGVHDFLATIYHHLGIDALNAHVPDAAGRPMPILPTGRPIPELTASR